jgi:hypothetical protein
MLLLQYNKIDFFSQSHISITRFRVDTLIREKKSTFRNFKQLKLLTKKMGNSIDKFESPMTTTMYPDVSEKQQQEDLLCLEKTNLEIERLQAKEPKDRFDDLELKVLFNRKQSLLVDINRAKVYNETGYVEPVQVSFK